MAAPLDPVRLAECPEPVGDTAKIKALVDGYLNSMVRRMT